jgi:RHS repeat-associated protein
MYDCAAQYASFAYKFTGKERDTESGLDNFGARYNASTMGRFGKLGTDGTVPISRS